MNRRRRTRILIEGNPKLAKKLSETITAVYEWKEIVAPRYGLTMVKIRESAKNSLFYIGEVLITEAKVEINGEIGIGIVEGMREELARQLAIIDAAYKANLRETKSWREDLLLEEMRINKQQAMEQAKLFETKVDFQTMETDS